MALINCPECNKEISDKAIMCPVCGYPLSENKVIAEEQKECDTEHVKKNNKQQSKILLILALMVVIGLAVYLLVKDKEPPVIKKLPNELSIKIGESLDIDELLATTEITDNSQKECKVNIDDKLVDYNSAGKYVLYVIAKDRSGNKTTKGIDITIENYATYSAYLDAINLTKENMEKRASGGYEYKGLNIPDEEVNNIEDGVLYRTLASHLVGFYMGESLYGMWGENTVPVIWGIEKPSAWNELKPRADKAIKLFIENQSLGTLMAEIESLSITKGNFDYVSGVFNFEISNLTIAADELEITETALGYMLAYLNEYGANTTFSKNMCTIALEWSGAKRTFDETDFNYYKDFGTEVSAFEELAGGGDAIFIYDDSNGISYPNTNIDASYYTTKRGVQFGISKKAIIFSHGGGTANGFSKTNDPVYAGLSNMQCEGILASCKSYICYKKAGMGQVVYYFDGEEKLIMTLYSKYEYY